MTTISEKGKVPYQKGSQQARINGAKGGASTAISRRAQTQPFTGTIIDLLDAAGMTEAAGWTPWRSFWRAVYCLKMSDAELAIYQKQTKRDAPPSTRTEECFVPVGRGSGKTRNAAAAAVFSAISFNGVVAPGEQVVIPLIAKDRKQARQAMSYCRGFAQTALVAPYVQRGDLAETIEFKTGVSIEIMTASFRSSRGYTCPLAVLDEAAFYFEEGASPLSEILTAIRGTLGRVPGGLLLVVSSPYAPSGEMYSAVESYWGNAEESERDGVLIWNSDTLSMNKHFSRRTIDREFRRDPVSAGSEYGCDGFVSFRQAAQALFDEAPMKHVTIQGRRELPPQGGVNYVAFIDAAEGSRSGDSMTLGIAHREGARAVLDCVRCVDPPFSPGGVIISTFAPVVHAYRCHEVIGDNHARGFVSDAFEGEHIKFVPSLLTKSDIYGELLPLVNTGVVELLELPALRVQLLALERRSMRGGRDAVDHPRGGHDDIANAAAGCLVHVTGVGTKKKKRVSFTGSSGNAVGRTPHDEMRDMIARTRTRLDARDRRDRQHLKESEGGPMISTPVWHVNQS